MTRKIYWFVETKDDLTNEAIAALLTPDQRSDNLNNSIWCKDDNRPHKVWILTESEMELLENSRASKNYKYKTFKGSERCGPITKAAFSKRRRPRAR